MDTIRMAICGCGGRGRGLTRSVIAKIPGVEVVGVADPYVDKAEMLRDMLKEDGYKEPAVFDNHQKMFDALKPDATLVVTSWETHIDVACDAMKSGVTVAMEVGGAYSIDECYKLVDTYETTKTPIMFMENCCFDKIELLGLNLARKGVLGEVVHAHGAYGHDVRGEISGGIVNRHYRLRNYINRNCENYPTHELGPIAKVLNINRGNRMTSLVSFASKSCGLKQYVKDKGIKELEGVEFKQGDVVETLIKCENGELISLKLDTTLPRFYSREFTLRGTKGSVWQESEMVLEEDKVEHTFVAYDAIKKLGGNIENYKDYMPKMWREITPEILEAGHGGMDYFEFKMFFDCIREGKEMPIDVYDAAAWMCITPLSEQSIANGGQTVEIPDFTRGKYKTRPIKDVIDLDND